MQAQRTLPQHQVPALGGIPCRGGRQPHVAAHLRSNRMCRGCQAGEAEGWGAAGGGGGGGVLLGLPALSIPIIRGKPSPRQRPCRHTAPGQCTCNLVIASGVCPRGTLAHQLLHSNHPLLVLIFPSPLHAAWAEQRSAMQDPAHLERHALGHLESLLHIEAAAAMAAADKDRAAVAPRAAVRAELKGKRKVGPQFLACTAGWGGLQGVNPAVGAPAPTLVEHSRRQGNSASATANPAHMSDSHWTQAHGAPLVLNSQSEAPRSLPLDRTGARWQTHLPAGRRRQPPVPPLQTAAASCGTAPAAAAC